MVQYIVKHDITQRGAPLVRIVCDSNVERGQVEQSLKEAHFPVMKPGNPATQHEDVMSYLGLATPDKCDNATTLFAPIANDDYIDGLIKHMRQNHGQFTVYNSPLDAPEPTVKPALKR